MLFAARRLLPCRVIASSLLLSPLALVVFACQTSPAYVFQARPYDPVARCVRGILALDVMSGSDPGTCAERCIVRSVDPNAALFVTDMCGFLPPGYRVESGELCMFALSVAAAGCADGGADAATSADASADSGSSGQ